MDDVIDKTLEADRMNKRLRSRRTLISVLWALGFTIMNSFLLYVLADIYYWEKNGDFHMSQYELRSFIFYLLVGIVVFIPIAAIVGYLTSPPSNFMKVMFISMSVTTLYFIGFVSWHIDVSSRLGTDWPPNPSLTDMHKSLITTVVFGLFLGIIVGFGYWKAGRKT